MMATALSVKIIGVKNCEASGRYAQRITQEAIAAHLQQHARQDHRAGSRRLHVRIRQPGMHRPHRHLDRERGKEGQP